MTMEEKIIDPKLRIIASYSRMSMVCWENEICFSARFNSDDITLSFAWKDTFCIIQRIAEGTRVQDTNSVSEPRIS